MAQRPVNPYIYVRIHGRDALFNVTDAAEAINRAEVFPEHVLTRWQRFCKWLVSI